MAVPRQSNSKPKKAKPKASRTAAKASTVTRESSTRKDAADALELLKADHRNVEKLFAEFEKGPADSEKQELVQRICRELIVHTRLEEEIFYPACRELIAEDPLDEAQVEHDGAKVLIGELLAGSPGEAFYDAKVRVLAEMIRHHVKEEEKSSEGIFAKAKAAGLDTQGIAQRLTARKAELQAESENLEPERPRPRSFTTIMEIDMPQGQYRDRDDRGRFSNDDDNGRYTSRSRNQNSRQDDDDDRGRMPQRDDNGRFMRENDDYSDRRYSGRDEDNRGQYGRSRGYDDDRYDDRRYSSGRGQDGQRRDDNGRYMSDDDRSSRGGRGREDRYGDSGNYRERDDRGRFMSDDDGYGRSSRSQSSRRQYRDDDGGDGRGWFGDREGHAEAARRGWESRSDREGDYGSRNQGGRGSRGRDDQDGRRSAGRSRSSQGGWFGDSEGHSEAARRGWENR
jgi:hemerythrin superfamily protein